MRSNSRLKRWKWWIEFVKVLSLLSCGFIFYSLPRIYRTQKPMKWCPVARLRWLRRSVIFGFQKSDGGACFMGWNLHYWIPYSPTISLGVEFWRKATCRAAASYLRRLFWRATVVVNSFWRRSCGPHQIWRGVALSVCGMESGRLGPATARPPSPASSSSVKKTMLLLLLGLGLRAWAVSLFFFLFIWARPVLI